MSDGDREELAALIRGFSAHFEWARETGATAVARRGGRASPPVAAAGEGASTRAPASVQETQVASAAIEPAARDRARERDAAEAAAMLAEARRAPAPTVARGAPGVATARPPMTPVPQAIGVDAARPSAPSAAPPPTPGSPAPAQRSLLPEAPTRAWGAILRGEPLARALEALEVEVRACQACKLCHDRTQTVFARGNAEAPLMFIGEAPGADEDRLGKPFVGAAGRLLDKIIEAMGLSEREVYIANVAKCRPPNNRPPLPEEVAACSPFLERQIELVRPSIIVALGRTPTWHLLQRTESMGKLRGRWFEYRSIPCMPTWHPAYLLRNPDSKGETWRDMQCVLEKMGRPLPTRARRT